MAALFPAEAGVCSADGGLSRTVLGSLLLAPGGEKQLAAVEGIVHPLVVARRQSFVQQHQALGTPLVVFDIPLLVRLLSCCWLLCCCAAAVHRPPIQFGGTST